ncbi:MAG: hypothetical protein K2X48_06365, partial [Chitinophagaceae bacterium]|nr:hypothetical protein [Chitinophagaceae bacterium]
KTDTPGLPPATQTGANTFGFLLNGQPWIPQGNNGSGNNLSIDYDPGINNGAFGISAYRATTSLDDDFGIGSWNLNSENIPCVINLQDNNRSNASFYTTINCWLSSRDSGTLRSGFFYIDKLDKQKQIIAGRFEFTLEKNGCPTITITKGRFDFKF